ncbi:MAG: alpha-ketoacid dehydrogenase subunit beta [Leucobacter sp.]
MADTGTGIREGSVETLSERTTLPLARAINEGLRAAMADNDRVLLMGEDIGPLGGVFRVTDRLQADFGSARVLDTPLAESGIVGSAIGLAMRGYRPVVEIQFDGFIFPAFNQIVSQLAKIRARHDGAVAMPVVIRVPYGGHISSIEHHEESPEAYFAHTPGLRVVAPSTPNDAYWMIQQAIASDDPVLFFEPKAKYWMKGDVDPSRPTTDLHRGRIARPGTDCTVVGFGSMVTTLLQAAEIAQSEGTSIEVVDLRSISPIDYEPLLASVRKTGRLVVAQEAPGNASVGSEIAATVAERAFYSLQAPVLRVSGYDVPFPAAAIEQLYLPDADRVLEAVDRTMHY